MPETYWQSILDKLTLRAASNGDLKMIENTLSEEALVRIFLKDHYKDDLIKWIDETCESSTWRKSISIAKGLREEGNKHFVKKNYGKSLSTYNVSIQYAPLQSEELALSLANRSAALVHTCKLQDAIEDIERAFRNGYPQNLRYKLHQRKGHCLMELGKYQDAITEYDCARNAVNDADRIPLKKKSQIFRDIENALSLSMKLLQTDNECTSSNKTEKPQLPVPFGGVSEELSYASKILSLQKNEEKGRHIVALDDIHVGDVLFVEKPFAFVLLPEHYHNRCHHCCNEVRTPVPCEECSQALYCNELCRRNSWDEYHKWECYGGLDIAHSVGIAHLGLRVLLTAGSFMDHKSRNKEFLSSKNEGKKNYSDVYHLLTHLETMSAEDRAAYTLTAVCLLLYLMYHTTYFVESTSDISVTGSISSNADYVMIGGIILHHVCQLVCNGHAVIAIQETILKEESAVVDQQQVRIATAIYPSASMMNHSCDPNIINSFWGTYLVVTAYKDINKGGEVFNCYGPNFQRMSKEERQEKLKSQYHFVCKCEACTDDHEFLDKFSALLCRICEGPLDKKDLRDNFITCNNCGSSFSYVALLETSKEAHALYEKGIKFLDGGSLRDALFNLLSCYEVQKSCLHQFHIRRRECLDGIAKCYAMLEDYSKSALYLLKTLSAIEEQFGCWSIELANEIHKLSDLMVHDLQITNYDKDIFMKKYAEAQKRLKKAKQLFQLHYGQWNNYGHEVEQKEELLNALLDRKIQLSFFK